MLLCVFIRQLLSARGAMFISIWPTFDHQLQTIAQELLVVSLARPAQAVCLTRCTFIANNKLKVGYSTRHFHFPI